MKHSGKREFMNVNENPFSEQSACIILNTGALFIDAFFFRNEKSDYFFHHRTNIYLWAIILNDYS